jgi:diguanylate cyclase (GGDEF)-like protein
VLALLIVAQVGLRMRRRDVRSARLCGGFLILGVADATFVGGVLHGSQDSSVATVVLWAAGFALLVSGASRPVVSAAERPISELPATILAGAAVAATVVQLIRPYGDLGLWLAAPAVVTIVSAVFRLILALRDARYAAEAIELAQTDDLTALPTRRAVLARVDADLAAGRPLALMIMDLDGFKDVNDALGHALGDLILRHVAGRMRSAMPEEVMVARLGGDEFAVVVPDTDELRLLSLANQAADAVRQPTLAVDMELVVGASVGVAVREAEDQDSSGLMRRADIAMYQAKVRGGGALLYDRRSDDSRQRLEMAEELRRALPEGQFVLYYQPQIDARTRRVCGVEGLVRWVHPSRGVLAPAAFLPTARHAALMPALSDAVLRRAVQDMSAWRGAGLDVERVALNFSPPELLGGVFATRFADAIAAAQLDPRAFVIEVTEDTFFSDPDRALEVLHQLRSCGTQVSIDDYGTGFSSLSYLRDVPVDELKMDRSFITGMVNDPRTRMIVESTVRLAEALDLRMVAEGVEDAATLALVSMTGADVVQGYYVARPMPATEVPRWYASWTRGVADILAIEAR